MTNRVATLSEARLHAGQLEAASTGAAQALYLSRTYEKRGHEACALRPLDELL